MSCGTSPIFSLTGSVSLLTCLPSMRTSPESVLSNPAMIETVVVLPAAIGPETDAGDGNQLSVILRKVFHFKHGCASMNMDEECITGTFSVDEQHAEVDTNGPKWVASLNRPIGRFIAEQT